MEKAKKDDVRARLKRIAGQVGGIQRMLDEERSYADVAVQVSAVRAALGKVSRLLLHEHLSSSVAEIIARDGRDRGHAMDELLRALERCDL
jgi:CsoR family transcriptional regulator, copper-sensing transcriptional repressor